MYNKVSVLVLLCSAMIGETLSLPLELSKGILGRKGEAEWVMGQREKNATLLKPLKC